MFEVEINMFCHFRYLDAKFVSDINLPDNSFVFLGVPVS